jgi:DNA-binding Lrp family transcriptional regulator
MKFCLPMRAALSMSWQKNVKLSPPSVSERIERLRERGVLRRFTRLLRLAAKPLSRHFEAQIWTLLKKKDELLVNR